MNRALPDSILLTFGNKAPAAVSASGASRHRIAVPFLQVGPEGMEIFFSCGETHFLKNPIFGI